MKLSYHLQIDLFLPFKFLIFFFASSTNSVTMLIKIYKKKTLNHPYPVPNLREQKQQESHLSLCYDVCRIFMDGP